MLIKVEILLPLFPAMECRCVAPCVYGPPNQIQCRPNRTATTHPHHRGAWHGRRRMISQDQLWPRTAQARRRLRHRARHAVPSINKRRRILSFHSLPDGDLPGHSEHAHPAVLAPLAARPALQHGRAELYRASPASHGQGAGCRSGPQMLPKAWSACSISSAGWPVAPRSSASTIAPSSRCCCTA